MIINKNLNKNPNQQLSPEDEEKRQLALKRAGDVYQDIKSPHYRDNERFSWAVKTINRKFFQDYD